MPYSVYGMVCGASRASECVCGHVCDMCATAAEDFLNEQPDTYTVHLSYHM